MKMKIPSTRILPLLGVASVVALLIAAGMAPSSHREAPFVTLHPKIDGTDFYMFRSYEPGRSDFVTIVANYQPLQAPYGGPNYFSLDPNALYEIHIDNTGDCKEDLTFQFKFQNNVQDLALQIGPPGQEKTVSVPLINTGPIAAGSTSSLNVIETYEVTLVRGDRRTGQRFPITNASTAATTFTKPVDNIGNKSIPNYDAYAATHVYDISIPGSPVPGRMFVGQRKDPFVVNLGEVFDLVNLDPVGAPNAKPDLLADANVTSLILELPISFLASGTSGSVIGGWTTASMRQARVLNPAPNTARGPSLEGGAFVQQSRLANPLFNEVIVGLKDKDKFNASEPKDDAQFIDYVTHPTVPAILQALFGVTAPTLFPRADLIQVFYTGVPGLNATTGCQGEMMRLNTATLPTPAGSQNRLGVIGGDMAGYPNGRRPGDDVVDISLRAVMGVLLPLADAPSGQLPYTDGAFVDDTAFDSVFPYLKTPLRGSPNPVGPGNTLQGK